MSYAPMVRFMTPLIAVEMSELEFTSYLILQDPSTKAVGYSEFRGQTCRKLVLQQPPSEPCT